MNNEKRTIIIIALITSICLLGNSMLYIVLPLYWKQVGLSSLWEVGILLSVNRLVRLPLNPFVGWLYRKISIRTGLIIAVTLAALTTTGYGVLSGFWLWLILRGLWGLAWSLLRVGGFMTVVNLAKDSNRGHLVGIYNGLYQFGNVFGMLLGGFLTGIIGFQSVAMLFGLMTTIGIPGILLFISNGQIPALVTDATSILKMDWLSKPVIKVVLSGMLIYMSFEGTVTSTLSYVISQNYGLDVTFFGITIAATALAGIILGARWAWEPFLASLIGRWSDGTKGRVPLFILFLVIAAGGFSLIPVKMPLLLWLSISILVLISATSLITLADSLAADMAKKTSALSVSTVYIVGADLGAAIGPMISFSLLKLEQGLIYTYTGTAVVFLIIALSWYLPHKKNYVMESYIK